LLEPIGAAREQYQRVDSCGELDRELTTNA
jgi:hypothetical protein